jgi:hypothetical protein
LLQKDSQNVHWLATLLSEIQSNFSQLSATVLARVLPSNKDLLSTLLVLCVFQITTLNNTSGVVSAENDLFTPIAFFIFQQ